ncbi:hypothetical protein NPIL_669641 [Nephila pilipes]|uniref:Uncharacterized protein n=1 Tax=Nephila pilipes TaxID=299642 RepID=A0A8X6Q9F1_NEPPI|nr:hypothetical protein NPIL_669641 [Nephila pilipes]
MQRKKSGKGQERVADGTRKWLQWNGHRWLSSQMGLFEIVSMWQCVIAHFVKHIAAGSEERILQVQDCASKTVIDMQGSLKHRIQILQKHNLPFLAHTQNEIFFKTKQPKATLVPTGKEQKQRSEEEKSSCSNVGRKCYNMQ